LSHNGTERDAAEWELGTIEGVAVSSGESKRYTVKRDAAPAFPSGIDIEYIRKKNQVMSVLMVVVWEKAVRSFGKRLR
jgi:hypothetical protein